MSRNMEITVDGTTIKASANTGNKQWVTVITDTHPKYNYERDFVCYQKPKTSKRDSGSATVEDGTVVEYVRYTHSGKNRSETYYQVVGEELHQIDEADVTAALEEIVVDAAPEPREIDDDLTPALVETHECECGKTFDSAHGLAVHVGMVHADDEEEEETPAEQTTPEQPIVADGGVTYDDYEIDPTELDYDTENRWHDSTNNISNALCRIKDTDVWVCYRTWQTGPNESDSAIKGMGKFDVEAVKLDTDAMVEYIRDEAAEMRESEYAALADTLASNAETLAEKLETEWAAGVEHLVGDAAYDGFLNNDSTLAWVSHVDEAFSHEADAALGEVGVEDSHGFAHDIVRMALYEAVQEHCDSWRNPHAEYVGRLTFEAEPWKLRALELEQNSVLKNKPELAKTKALLEEGHDYREIADRLGKSNSTVSRQKSQLQEWEERAAWTVTELDDSGR
jgi:hypothetical protein